MNKMIKVTECDLITGKKYKINNCENNKWFIIRLISGVSSGVYACHILETNRRDANLIVNRTFNLSFPLESDDIFWSKIDDKEHDEDIYDKLERILKR